MAGLLAANLVAVLQHVLEDVAVADLRDFSTAARRLDGLVETDVRHDRRDDRVVRQRAGFDHVLRAHHEDVVAIDDLAFFIDAEAAVGVAVMRDAEICMRLEHRALQRFEMRRAAPVVDVDAIRQRMDDLDLRAELAQHARHDLVRRTIRAVEHDVHAVEALVARRKHEIDVLVQEIGAILDVADFLAGRTRERVVLLKLVHDGLKLVLDRIRQLVAVAAKELDAVVMKRIVRGRNHDARLRLVAACEIRDGGRRDDASEHRAAACRANARRQRRFEHLARNARVAADQDERLLILLAEIQRRRSAEAVRHLRQQRHIRFAADAVGSKKSCHENVPLKTSNLSQDLSSYSGSLSEGAVSEAD